MTHADKIINKISEKAAQTGKVQGVFRITNQHLFEEMANKVWCKRGDKGYNTLQIAIDRKYDLKYQGEKKRVITTFSLRTVAQPWNAMVDYLDLENVYSLVEIGKKKKAETIKRLTFSEIHVQCKSAMAANILMDTKRILIKGCGLGMIIAIETRNGQIYDITKQITDNVVYTTCSRDMFYDENDNLLEGVHAYGLGRDEMGYQFASASQMKQQDITIPEISNKTAKRFMAVCNGTFGEIMSYDDIKDLTLEELSKLASRLSLFFPPAGLLDAKQYHLKSVAVFMGKFKNEDGNEFEDGQHLGTAESLAAACNAASNKFQVVPEACLGVHAQDRPFCANKSKVEFVMQDELSYRIRKIGVEVVVLRKGSITKQQQKDFNSAIKNKKGPYKGKIVIICDDNVKDPIGECESLSDLNAVKCPWNLKTDSNWHILKFSHAPKDVLKGAKISNMLLQSLMLADFQGTFDFIGKLLKKDIDEKIERLITEELRAPSSMDFIGLNSLNIPSVAMNCLPSYVKKYEQDIYRAWADNEIKSTKKGATEIKLHVEGAYLMLTPDIATRWGSNVLEVKEDKDGVYIEVVSNYADRYKIEKFIAIKYPKMHTREYLKCKIISSKEYAQRVMNSDKFTKEEKVFLMRDIYHLSAGMVMIPSVEIIKNLAAGLDFDSDACQCFYNNFIVDTLWKETMEAVQIIKEADVKDEANPPKKYQCDNKIGLTAFNAYCHNDNKSIGEITIMNEIFIDLLIMMKNYPNESAENYTARLMFMTIFFPHEDSNLKAIKNALGRKLGRYWDDEVSDNSKVIDKIKTYPVTDDYANKVLWTCQHMSPIMSNFAKALLALQVVGRSKAERTLDAAKGNEAIQLGYDANKFVSLMSRQEVDFKILWNGGKLNGFTCDDKFAWKFDSTQTISKEKAYKDEDGNWHKHLAWDFHDPIHMLREKGMTELRRMGSALLDIRQDMHPEIEAMIDKVENDPKYQEIIKSVFSQRKLYGDIVELRRKEKVTARQEAIAENHGVVTALSSDEKEQIRKTINKKYSDFFKAFSNNIRIMLKDYSLEEKIIICMIAGRRQNQDANGVVEQKEATNFVAKALPEEYLKFLVSHFGEIKETKDKLLYISNSNFDGKITFKNGVGFNEDKTVYAVSKDDLEGEYTIKFDLNSKGRKVAYAVANIEDFIKIPEPDETMRFFVTAEKDDVQKNFYKFMEEFSCASEVLLVSAPNKKATDVSSQAGNINANFHNVGKFKLSSYNPERELYHMTKGIVTQSIVGNITRSQKVQETNKVVEVEKTIALVILGSSQKEEQISENVAVEEEVNAVPVDTNIILDSSNELFAEDECIIEDLQPVVVPTIPVKQAEEKPKVFDGIISEKQKVETKATLQAIFARCRQARANA